MASIGTATDATCNIHNELARDVYRFQLRDDETFCLQNEAQCYYWNTGSFFTLAVPKQFQLTYW